MTATQTLTIADLHAAVAAATLDIASITEEQNRLAVSVLRQLPHAKEDYEACEARLVTAHQTLTIAEAAIVAIEAEEAAAADAADAEEHARLEAARAKAEESLNGHLRGVETHIATLAEAVHAALAAADEFYNAGVNLGMHGSPVGTRDRVSGRIGHLLRLAGLPDFDLGLTPAARQPLTGEVQPRPVPPSPAPLRDRRDIHADDGRGRVVQSFLKDDNGEWVEVAPGAVELPAERIAAPGAGAAVADKEDLAADRAKRKAMDEATQARKRAASRAALARTESA